MNLRQVVAGLLICAMPSVALAQNCVPNFVESEVLPVEIEYPTLTLGGPSDTRPLVVVKPKPTPDPRVPLGPRTESSQPTLDVLAVPLVPDPTFDSTTSDDNPGFVAPPDPTAAVGLNHIVDATNMVVSFLQKDGTLICRGSLQTFFASLTPLTPLFDPRVLYDHYYDRFVLIAMDKTDDQVPGQTSNTSRMLVAVSDDGNPIGTWRLAAIPTLLPTFDPDGGGPRPPEPHWADFPQLGMERRQLFTTFNMFSFMPGPVTPGVFGGVTLWNLWKWDVTDPSPSGGLYGGGTVTIHAGLRPFSLNSDYQNEIPLTPVTILNEFTTVVNRGIYLLGYSGGHDAGTNEEYLQVFWYQVVGINAVKRVVSLGNVDAVTAPYNEATPPAPQIDSSMEIVTGDRRATTGAFRNFEIWTAIMVNPPSGPDSGQATVHWVQLDAPSTTPMTGTPTVGEQDDIGAEIVTTQASTFYPALSIGTSGGVGVGFSLSSPDLHPSSFYQRLDGGCAVQEAPQALRLGVDIYERPEMRWGDYSAISFDPSDGDCFWAFHQHALSRAAPPSPGNDGRWGTAHGKFCPVTGVFCDGFNTGNTVYWSLVEP